MLITISYPVFLCCPEKSISCSALRFRLEYCSFNVSGLMCVCVKPVEQTDGRFLTHSHFQAAKSCVVFYR